MLTSQLFRKKKVFSFEVFPPKKDSSVSTIYKTLEKLKALSPDYISVTYGAAGGSSRLSIKIASDVKNIYGIESVAHIPCIDMTKSEVLAELHELKKDGIENILALRGDINPSVPPKQDFKYASDLIAFIRKHGSFNIIGACYPEVHPEAKSAEDDLQNLKMKVEAGASQLITQLFFDNSSFYRFRERARAVGIDVPIQAGIMPVTNKKQIARMVSLCGVAIPEKLSEIIEKYGDDSASLREAGIAYAIGQISNLAANGVDGIHLYTMNNAYVAKKICEATIPLICHE
jgi:methylenetetrahydrofolate reductase (NADPH)